MAMSRDVRLERSKSLELLWHFLEGKKCFFCKERLANEPWPIQYGNANAPVMDVRSITIHHKNGDHSDNSPKNRALAHQKCHKSYHAKLVFGAYNKATRKAA
jgi:hypothetical protein